MDAVRYTVVDVNRLQQPTKGFETGRVYLGIRGVVPVSAENSDGFEIHVGALEAGTSFSAMLNLLHDELESHIAILLSKEHVTENMWPDFINNHFKDTDRIDGFFIESASMDKAHQFLGQPQVIDLLQSCRAYPKRDWSSTKESGRSVPFRFEIIAASSTQRCRMPELSPCGKMLPTNGSSFDEA
jgi:hypothetical protein